MESSECQSHSSLNSVQSNSKLLDLEPVTEQKNSEYKGITEVEPICRLQETENNHVHTTESLFKDCKKCNGLIGVPITFFSEFCSKQFRIIGAGNGKRGQEIGIGSIPKEIKRQMVGHSAAGDLYVIINGKPKVPYNRILIQRKPIKE